MAWSVAARFHLDPTDWTLARLEFWYRGHVALHREEEEAIIKAQEAAKHGQR